MQKESLHITGESVMIRSVTGKDLDDYLYIRRYATIFKTAYDTEDGLWEHMKPGLIEDIKGPNIICLIYQRQSQKRIGYIELEMKDVHRPKVGIGILEEERKKGYAFEAASLLINKVFEDEGIEYMEWLTTEGNEASHKTAQKLGGEIIRREPLIPADVMERWGGETPKEKGIPCYVVYGIYRK